MKAAERIDPKTVPEKFDIFYRARVSHPEFILATCSILGQEFHAEFLRVVSGEDGVQIPTFDPYHRLETFYKLDENGRFCTVKIPGVKGDWVCVISPYSK